MLTGRYGRTVDNTPAMGEFEARCDEVVEHPQLAHRDVLQTIETPHGDMTLVSSGFKLAHGGSVIDRPPAAPGEHNEEVLSCLLYTSPSPRDLSTSRMPSSA